MSSPSTKIRPEVGSISLLTIIIVVVLPQPDGPTRVTSSPSSTAKDRSCTAVVPSGYRLVTSSNRIIPSRSRRRSLLAHQHHLQGARTVHPLDPVELDVAGGGRPGDPGERAGRIETLQGLGHGRHDLPGDTHDADVVVGDER